MKKPWTIVIVIAVIVGAVWWFNGGSSKVSLYSSVSTSPTVSATKTPAGYKATKATKTATPVPLATSALSYSQLVTQYGTNRIQFDTACQAQPNSPVFKNGARILLDNRANQARTITVDGARYNLVAYGYQIITLASSTLPKKLNVSCGDLVNVGSILLQANISGQ